MNKLIIALIGASVLAISGCAGNFKDLKTAATPATPTLSAEAQAALKQAQTDVASAKKQKALWTPAADDLKDAEKAASTGNSAAVIKQAKSASELSKLGIEQLSLPTTDHFNN